MPPAWRKNKVLVTSQRSLLVLQRGFLKQKITTQISSPVVEGQRWGWRHRLVTSRTWYLRRGKSRVLELTLHCCVINWRMAGGNLIWRWKVTTRDNSKLKLQVTCSDCDVTWWYCDSTGMAMDGAIKVSGMLKQQKSCYFVLFLHVKGNPSEYFS